MRSEEAIREWLMEIGRWAQAIELDQREVASRIWKSRSGRSLDGKSLWGLAVRDGIKPLHFAAWGRQIEEVKHMLATGAEVDVKTGMGETPLMVTLRTLTINRQEGERLRGTVELLIKSGADVNTKDQHGVTPLMKAVVHGTEEVCRMLIAAGARVNEVDKKGSSALMRACQMRHAQDEGIWNSGMGKIEALWEAGAEPDLKDQDGRTALDWARAKGLERVAEWIRARELACQEKEELNGAAEKASARAVKRI